MPAPQFSFARRTQSILSRIDPDRRRHKRLSVTLLGRFMRESKREYACKLHDISVGGAAIFTPIEADVGERVVAYFDFVGGIEGGVVRVFDGGFAFKIQATQHKREKLAAQLTWLANRSELAAVEERKHERLAPKQSTSSLRLGEGITVDCRVLDVSISGASVASSARPVIGTEVLLGKMRALVVRHHDEGFGVRFIDIQNPAALRNCFVRYDANTAKP
jgi:hypothetical protein